MDKTSPSPSRLSTKLDLELDNLKALRILGKGAMGTVFLVHDALSDPNAQNTFALKVVEKEALRFKSDAERRARWEICVLKRISEDCERDSNNPFVPRLLPRFLGSLETDEFLAWSFPCCPGGDLHALRHRQPDRVFSVAAIRFYLAEIVCALDHLHSMGIAYRDLKPENILVQQSGHVTLTDFDLSRRLRKKNKPSDKLENTTRPVYPNPTRNRFRVLTRWIPVVPIDGRVVTGLRKTKSARVSPVSRRGASFSSGERSHSFVGTEEYVSPEMVSSDGHEFAVDWWALGVLAYEMLYGTTPFKGKTRKETFRNILHKQPEFVGQNRTALSDLIERLLKKDPQERLGYCGGGCEIKRHVFFQGLRWDLLTEVLRPPFIPSKDDGELTEKQGADDGLDITEYFRKMKSPASVPPSPEPSPTSGVLFSEY